MTASTGISEISQDRPSADELYRSAEALVPMLRERARAAEEARRVSDETLAAIEDAGLFSIVSPAHLGGYGYGIEEVSQLTRILAHGCASTAWVFLFINYYNIQIAQDAPQLLEGKPYVRAALSAGAHLAPSGTAIPVDGGWRVSGRWPYASAILHAQYAMLVTTEATDGSSDSRPKILGLICNASDVEILDDWEMSGMAATGSNSFELQDVFIPSDRSWNVWGSAEDSDDAKGSRERAKFTIIGGFGVPLVGCAVGVVEAALADFAERIRTRVTPLGGGPQREHREAWGRYGQAFTEIRVARLLWEESLRMIADFTAREVKPTMEEAATLKMATPRIAQLAADALEIIVQGSGSSVYKLSDPLQRQQRDVAVLKSHALMSPDSAYVPAGQALLGLGSPDDPLFST